VVHTGSTAGSVTNTLCEAASVLLTTMLPLASATTSTCE